MEKRGNKVLAKGCDEGEYDVMVWAVPVKAKGGMEERRHKGKEGKMPSWITALCRCRRSAAPANGGWWSLCNEAAISDNSECVRLEGLKEISEHFAGRTLRWQLALSREDYGEAVLRFLSGMSAGHIEWQDVQNGGVVKKINMGIVRYYF